MSSNWEIKFDDGRVWFVGACAMFGEPKQYPNGAESSINARIIIPLCQLEGLTAEQIGNKVLDLSPTARTCFAAHVASAYAGSSQQEYQQHAPGEYLEAMALRDLPLLEAHRNDKAANPQLFEEAIAFLEEMKGRYEAAQLRKRFKVHPARRVIAKDYDALFIGIGKRDGFHCGSCKATKNLQIDHVKPVSVGGSSEIENLQLLCGLCNSQKGDKTIDYREAAA